MVSEAQMNLEADPVPGFLENRALNQHFKVPATSVFACLKQHLVQGQQLCFTL